MPSTAPKRGRALLLAWSSLAMVSGFPGAALSGENGDTDKPAPAPSVSKEIPRIDAKDGEALREALGKEATIHGRITRTKDWNGGANFLDFEGGRFMLVCFESNYANFPKGRPAVIYRDKRVEDHRIHQRVQGPAADQAPAFRSGQNHRPGGKIVWRRR